jgi:acyl carrier protein
MSDTLTKVSSLIHDLFDEYDGPVTRNLTAMKVSQWDSLGHVQLMVLVEQAFGIRFSPDQIGKFRDVGDLVDEIDRKVKSKA